MERKLVLWFVLLSVGFLAGFILQYARLQQAQQELSASTKQLGSCQAGEQLSQLRDTATAMFLEAVQRTTERPGRTRKSSSIKLSEFRAARETPHFATCFATLWQPAIRSQRIWQRETPLHFQKYRHSYPRSSRPRSINFGYTIALFKGCQFCRSNRSLA